MIFDGCSPITQHQHLQQIIELLLGPFIGWLEVAVEAFLLLYLVTALRTDRERAGWGAALSGTSGVGERTRRQRRRLALA